MTYNTWYAIKPNQTKPNQIWLILPGLIGNGIGDPSSNSVQGCLGFTLSECPSETREFIYSPSSYG